jgi:diaminohydroxyphosphoribosylaminopyrimidine deaminase / 5-amino-6-(5-phosphoribosylamino)uracil reductase
MTAEAAMPKSAPVPVQDTPGSSAQDAAARDLRFMRLALALGRRGLGRTWPNPSVGAVLVKDGIIVGRGWTQKGGRPHAETEALRQAKKDARGATLYVTLEPCSHQGKTPPCADAIIKADVARVVSAMDDPNPEVAGQGHEKLRAKKIAAEVGLCREEAMRSHAGHIRRVTDARPHVLLKLAVSADEKAGGAGRTQVSITGDEARDFVFQTRACNDAIMVGIGTVLSDDPALTCRLPGMEERSPVRVVLDAKLRTPLANAVIATARETPTFIFAAQDASKMAEDILLAKGAEVMRVDAAAGRLDLAQILKILAERGITRLMVEGGPRIAASLFQGDLIDEVMLLRGTKPIGADGINALEGMPLSWLTESSRFRLSEHMNFGADRLDHFERV